MAKATLAISSVLVLGTSALLKRVEVEGPSMLPTLQAGDRLLVVRSRALRIGDLVVFADPDLPERLLVKRAIAFAGEDVEVAGDNAGVSRDSRRFGLITRSTIWGIVRYRYFPPGHTGVLRRPPRPARTTRP